MDAVGIRRFAGIRSPKSGNSISDTTVTQHLDLSSPGIAYPVVADPFWGHDIFYRPWTGIWGPGGTPNPHEPPGPYVSVLLTRWGDMIQTGLAFGGGFGAWGVRQYVLNHQGWSEMEVKAPVVKTKLTFHEQFTCHALGAYNGITGGPTWDFEGGRYNRPNWLWDGGATRYHCNWPPLH